MKKRWKILIAACIALGLAILLPVIRHYQLRFAVESYLAELKAKGEPMELAQVIPPPVPPEQNSADNFRHAAELIDADKSLLKTNYSYGMKMVAPGRAIIRWQEPDIRDKDSTNFWEALESAVAQNKQALNFLRQIIERPALDFQIHYERGLGGDFDWTNLNLVQLKKSGVYLSAAALADLRRGDSAAAVKNTKAMLVLANALQEQRYVISELVRIAIAAIAQHVTWEILQSPQLSDEQLAELQTAWQRLDYLQGYRDALNMERVSGELTLSRWRNLSMELEKYFGLMRESRETLGIGDEAQSALAKSRTAEKIFLWRYWWSYPDELRSLRGHEVMLESSREVQTNGEYLAAFQLQQARLDALGINKVNSELDGIFSTDMDFHSMLSGSIAVLGNTLHRVMVAETSKRAIVTAIALKRYQLKHGNYPADLNSLVPEFLPAVPLDPVDGQPLRYRHNADKTFLLYSVGENGVDDGGNPALEPGVTSSSFAWQNPHALDWVWPQPATAEEIQKYYEEQARKSK